MKQTLKSILALAMVLCMLFTVVGCGGDKPQDEQSSEQQVAVDDSFFDAGTTTSKETSSKEETSSNQQTSSKQDVASNANSNANSSATSSSSSKKETSSKENTKTEIGKENTIGGKTWTQVLQSMPTKLRGTSLVMYNWNPASEYTGAPEVIDRFTKQTGIKVEWRTIPYASYFTKLPALIASGENIPDMVRTRGPQPSFMQNLQPISKTGYDFTDEAWDQKLMELYTYGDNTFATSLQNTHIGCVSLMFFNQSLVDKYELENPYKLWKAGKWTWDKYLEMAREFADITGQSTGANGEGHFGYYTSFYGLQGAIAYNGKKFYNAMKEKNFLEVHQKLGDLYNKEKLFAFGGAERFNDGQVLFSIGSAVHLRRKNSYFGNLKNANTLMAVPFPQIKGQKYYQALGEAEAYGIAEGAKNVEAVPYFLRFFLDGANYDLGNYFCNKQNLEVYNWCMSQNNKIFSYGYPTGMAGIDNTNTIESQQGGQMKSYIDANYGTTDKAVAENNKILKELKAK